MNTNTQGAPRIEAVGPCPVGPAILSRWRAENHWHAVWPEGDTWCFQTASQAADRAVEVAIMRSSARVRRNVTEALAARQSWSREAATQIVWESA